MLIKKQPKIRSTNGWTGAESMFVWCQAQNSDFVRKNKHIFRIERTVHYIDWH